MQSRLKKNGETPFGGRFAKPAIFWCYAHQTAPKVDDLWTPVFFKRQLALQMVLDT